MTVSTANVTSTGTLVATPCVALGVYIVGGATAGSVILKDGGGSGTVKATFQVPAAAEWGGFIPFPGGGLQFNTDAHATISVAVGVTLIYDN